jgi:PAS domain-containing protein
MLQSDLIDILLVSSDFIFLSTDHIGTVKTVTPACREVIKKREGEVEGKTLDEIVPELAFYPQSEFEIVQPRGGLELMLDDDEYPQGCEFMEFLASHTQENGRFEIETTIEGQQAWLAMVTNKILVDGDIIFTVMIRDITRRKLDEKEILDLNQNLEARVESRTEQIKNVVISCSTELEQVNQTYQAMKEQQMDIMENIENAVLSNTDGLSESQKAQIQEAVSGELVKCMNLYSEDQITDQKFMLTMMSLNELFGGASKEDENLRPDQLAGSNQDEVDDLLSSLGI